MQAESARLGPALEPSRLAALTGELFPGLALAGQPAGFDPVALWTQRIPPSPGVAAMRQLHALAQRVGYPHAVTFSPWFLLLDHGVGPLTGGAGAGRADAASDTANPVWNPASGALTLGLELGALQRAGTPVVPWTVDEPAEMRFLLDRGLKGIITDRPDLLRQVLLDYAREHGGSYVGPDGLIDGAQFVAESHRGGGSLRPENTLPAVEAGLDSLVNGLEVDFGVTRDGVPVLSHDDRVNSQNARRSDGARYEGADEVVIRDLTLDELRSRFIFDKVRADKPQQTNDLAASPVAVAFAQSRKLPHVYTAATVDELFEFVRFYADYYRQGPGREAPDAELRWKNAERVRLTLEPKVPAPPGVPAPAPGAIGSAEDYVKRLLDAADRHGFLDRVKLHCFDRRAVEHVIERYPRVPVAWLFMGL